MFEFFKIIWDMIVLRDSASKGQLKVRQLLFGFGFAILLYAIGVPAAVLYSKHPQYKPLFIAAIVLDGLLFIAFMVYGIRGYFRSAKHPNGPDDQRPSNQP
jgi:cytochrome c biogenesis protein CcdA